jgi:hypothetical protein
VTARPDVPNTFNRWGGHVWATQVCEQACGVGVRSYAGRANYEQLVLAITNRTFSAVVWAVQRFQAYAYSVLGDAYSELGE